MGHGINGRLQLLRQGEGAAKDMGWGMGWVGEWEDAGVSKGVCFGWRASLFFFQRGEMRYEWNSVYDHQILEGGVR